MLGELRGIEFANKYLIISNVLREIKVSNYLIYFGKAGF
jgi:hypothetical protein